MGDPEIRREGVEGSGIFQNVPACDRYLTSTELSTPIKEDSADAARASSSYRKV